MAYTINEERLNTSINMLLEGHTGDLSFQRGSFAADEYYKYEILGNARSLLNLESWDPSMLGQGHIFNCVQAAVNACRNLVDYRNKDISEAYRIDPARAESILYDLYKTEQDELSFKAFIAFFHSGTDLVTYLFFLKDPEKYVPFRSWNFEYRLSWIGVASDCFDQLTWDAFQEFIAILTIIRKRIEPRFHEPVTLLDAHSFVWMMWKIKDALSREPAVFLDYSFGKYVITKEQWREVFRNLIIREKDYAYLSKFYSAPNHATTLKRLGQLEGKSPSAYISRATSIGKRVLSALQMETIIRNGTSKKYYPVCFLGRYDKDHNYEWMLRPELMEVLQERCSLHLNTAIETFDILERKEAEILSDEELRKRAETASLNERTEYVTTSKRIRRDPAISLYAKRRANGVCQLCKQKGPFQGSDGRPYLETHHVRWLSRGGLDSLDNIVALCPNCHRKMHVIDDPSDIAALRGIAERNQ